MSYPRLVHRPIAPLALAALLTLSASCGSDSPTQPQSGTIEIQLLGASFSPSEVVITRGSTVRWTNASSELHTITPQGHAEWSEITLQEAGQEFSHTFDEVGEFPYHCVPHLAQGMTGLIRVVEP